MIYREGTIINQFSQRVGLEIPSFSNKTFAVVDKYYYYYLFIIN